MPFRPRLSGTRVTLVPGSRSDPAESRSHDHREHTKIDYVLECAAGAAVELDGERVTVGRGGAVLIPPGCDTGQRGG
jgi:quercetin dioxygenase-like cupin family protein